MRMLLGWFVEAPQKEQTAICNLMYTKYGFVHKAQACALIRAPLAGAALHATLDVHKPSLVLLLLPLAA
jgi:hypothetical protein